MLSDAGKFYIEKLICEFEYLYQMSLSSLMPLDFINELSSKWLFEKELTVLRFLQGMFVILSETIESYNEEEIASFIKFFCQDNQKYCKPYRRMLSFFISVMKNKVQRAENNNTKSVDKLKNILFDAEALEKKAISFFSNKLSENNNNTANTLLMTKIL